MPVRHRLLQFIRKAHLYLGVFAAPALMFFAVSGGLQTFGLHEDARDGSYRAPAWLASVGMLHKKQTTVVKRKPRPASGGTSPARRVQPPAQPRGSTTNLLPMKVFFALVAISLLLSTLSGLAMAFHVARRRWLLIALAVAGLVLPWLLWLV